MPFLNLAQLLQMYATERQFTCTCLHALWLYFQPVFVCVYDYIVFPLYMTLRLIKLVIFSLHLNAVSLILKEDLNYSKNKMHQMQKIVLRNETHEDFHNGDCFYQPFCLHYLPCNNNVLHRLSGVRPDVHYPASRRFKRYRRNTLPTLKSFLQPGCLQRQR